MGLKDRDMGLNSANGFLKHAVNNMYGIEVYDIIFKYSVPVLFSMCLSSILDRQLFKNDENNIFKPFSGKSLWYLVQYLPRENTGMQNSVFRHHETFCSQNHDFFGILNRQISNLTPPPQKNEMTIKTPKNNTCSLVFRTINRSSSCFEQLCEQM